MVALFLTPLSNRDYTYDVVIEELHCELLAVRMEKKWPDSAYLIVNT